MTRLQNLASVAALIFVMGCAQYTDKRGVEATWHPEAIEQMKVGESTRKESYEVEGLNNDLPHRGRFHWQPAKNFTVRLKQKTTSIS